jgi:hypothetical protein
MTKLVTTSVVRGSHQGDSHGGVYLIDLDRRQVTQKVDWNTIDIDWRGRGADRGLRGIAFDGDVVYIAASDELFAYTRHFEKIASWRNPYLRHCHEIVVHERTLFMTSTGFDSIVGFDLDRKVYDRGEHIETRQYRFKATQFDPCGDDGPLLLDKLHINSIFCDSNGMYLGGTRTGGMLHFNGRTVLMAAELPPGTHNARPFRDCVLFNDTCVDRLRYCGRGEGEEDRAFAVPKYAAGDLTHTKLDDSRIARQGFARGLCLLSPTVVAGGSSPSTIALYDLATNMQLMSVNLTMDIRNAIHGLEVWPYN